MPNRTEQTIAVAFDLNFGHAAEVFRGISEHRTRRGLTWRLLPLNYGFESTLMELVERKAVDAVIGTFVSDRWLEGLRSHSLPAVNVFNFARIRSVPSVAADDRAIGAEAARHLLEQGATCLGFLGEGRIHQSTLRREGFAGEASRLLPAAGNLDCEPLSDLRTGPGLGGQLLDLTAGRGSAGLFCSSDRLAREAAVEAENHGLRVGRELFLVGVGNDPAESVYAGTSLSSFALPSRRIGQEAARMIETLLTGEALTESAHVLGPPELIARDSSLVGGRARLARRALTLIQERFEDPDFSVDGLARATGASRRSLESSLREHSGMSPYQLLCVRRLEHARNLLAGTDVPVGRIGERCGFSGPHHFSAWFRKQAGLPPREFRQRERARQNEA